MLLNITTSIALILLALFMQDVEGFQRAIVVAGSDVTVNDSFTKDDKDNIATRAILCCSTSNTFRNSCCVYGNCSCPSLYHVLANLTSNVLINITTDVELSLIVPIVGLANFTITGHNNPTINCNNSGGLHFLSCYNCIIEGITWEGCGARNISDDDDNIYPVLQFTNSSNITIQNCSLQQSIGQAIVLLGMSGDVNINYSNFLSNKHYEGHGTAIHYSSNNMLSSPLKLTITGCNFSYNGRAKSIIYFGHLLPILKFCEYLKLQNSLFHHNRGVPIYLSNYDLHINGNIEFYSNVAENGGGIYISDHSNVIFHKSATVNFTNNTATNNGGAIFLTNYSSILFKDHSTSCKCSSNKQFDALSDQFLATFFAIVKFYKNTATGFGQDIYAHNNSNVTVSDNATLIFDGNNKLFYSSAIHTDHYCTVTFEGNSKTVCNNYWVDYHGGAMYIADYSVITFKGNSTVTFNHNVVYSIFSFDNYGGAFYINSSTATFLGNSTVTFSNNSVYSIGGAMYINDHSNITFKGNSTIMFSNNKAYTRDGGAMYVNNYSTITFEGNSTVTFSDNKANKNGGGMYIIYKSTISFLGNSKVTFSHNVAPLHVHLLPHVPHGYGGAMHINDHSTITFEENSVVTFSNNAASTDGGALYIDSSTITFLGNSTVTFTDNKVHNSNGGANVASMIWIKC